MNRSFAKHLHQAQSYLEPLRQAIAENQGVSGYKGKLSQAAGCQPSYLSQVLGEKAHFTADHAAGLTEFWDFTELETDFFMDLVRLERAATQRLKILINAKIERSRSRLASIESAYDQYYQIPPQHQADFYLQWHMSSIFMMCQLKRFNTPQSMAAHLGLTEPVVEEAIAKLINMDLIRPTADGFEQLQPNLFLFKGSPFRTAFINSYRQLASVKRDIINNDNNFSYTMLYAMRQKDAKDLRDLIVGFVKDTKKVYEGYGSGGEDELVCLALDYFHI